MHQKVKNISNNFWLSSPVRFSALVPAATGCASLRPNAIWANPFASGSSSTGMNNVKQKLQVKSKTISRQQKQIFQPSDLDF